MHNTSGAILPSDSFTQLDATVHLTHHWLPVASPSEVPLITPAFQICLFHILIIHSATTLLFGFLRTDESMLKIAPV